MPYLTEANAGVQSAGNGPRHRRFILEVGGQRIRDSLEIRC